jgi:hypothetical protein
MPETEKVIAHSKNHLDKLHAYIERESDFFPGQRDNEKVQMCVRSHWLREMRILLSFIVLAVIFPIVALYFLHLFDFGGINWSFIHLFLGFYLAGVWLYAFVEFIKSELTAIIVTNERIVDLTQTSLFNRQLSEISLNRIQEVTGFATGLIQNFFDVGKLEIQSSSVEIPLTMLYVKSPHLTSRKILDIQRIAAFQRRTSDFGARTSDRLNPRKGENYTKEELLRMRNAKKDSQEGFLNRDWSKEHDEDEDII